MSTPSYTPSAPAYTPSAHGYTPPVPAYTPLAPGYYQLSPVAPAVVESKEGDIKEIVTPCRETGCDVPTIERAVYEKGKWMTTVKMNCTKHHIAHEAAASAAPEPEQQAQLPVAPLLTGRQRALRTRFARYEVVWQPVEAVERLFAVFLIGYLGLQWGIPVETNEGRRQENLVSVNTLA